MAPALPFSFFHSTRPPLSRYSSRMLLAAALAVLATTASGQVSPVCTSVLSAGSNTDSTFLPLQCMSLSGSALCPAFQSLSINPANLSSAWPFFASVYNVATFDAELSSYLAPGGAFAKQKQKVELGCANYGTDAVLQWQQIGRAHV